MQGLSESHCARTLAAFLPSDTDQESEGLTRAVCACQERRRLANAFSVRRALFCCPRVVATLQPLGWNWSTPSAFRYCNGGVPLPATPKASAYAAEGQRRRGRLPPLLFRYHAEGVC